MGRKQNQRSNIKKQNCGVAERRDLNRFFAALRMTNGNLVGWAVPMRKSGTGSLRLGRGDSGIRLRCSGPTEGEFQGV